MENRKIVVKELLSLIRKGNAHAAFEEAVKEIAFESLNAKPAGLPYTIWQLVEHIRITQWDILEFCKQPGHTSPDWPDGYWPAAEEKADLAAWEKTLESIRKDRASFIQLLEDEHRDLHAPFPYGDGQSLFREALVLADHTSYHLGQIIVLRRLLGDWNS